MSDADASHAGSDPASGAPPVPGADSGAPPPMDPAVLAALAAEYRGGTLVTAAIACYCIASLFISLRLLTRLWIVKMFIVSDWLILAGWMFAGGMTAGFIVEAHSGLGHHIMTVSPDHAVRFGKAYYATNLLYIGALVCVKVSIVFLFLRILNTARVHRVCYGVLGFILLFGLYSIITNIFICYPQAKFWDPFHHPEGWCFPIRKFWSDVAGHLVGEFMLLILPMPYIFKLKMPLKQKAAVGSLFAMGAFVIIISFIRIPSLRKAETSQDPTWDGVDGAVWSCVEICIAIVCACSMTLRPLASKVLPGLISSSYVQASGPSGQKRRILTVGSERKHRRTHGSTSAAGSGSGRSMLDMDEVPHLPAKPSYSTMSQSTAVLSDTSRSPRSMDDTEKGLGHGHPF